MEEIGACIFGEKEVTVTNIGNRVKDIGKGAFMNTTIEQELLPELLSTIGEEAFRGCKGLSSLRIPSSVRSVGDYAFCGCEDITSVPSLSICTSIWSPDLILPAIIILEMG